jgi:hypothetical protein
MSFDSEYLKTSSSNLPNNVTDRSLNLRAFHDILLHRYHNVSSSSDFQFPTDQKYQFDVYCEVFHQLLPKSFQQPLLKDYRKSIKPFKDVLKNTECLPSLIQSEIALNLEKNLLGLAAEKAKKGTKKVSSTHKEYIIENKFKGLSNDILPVDIAIKEKGIKKDKLLLFIEVIPFSHRNITTKGEGGIVILVSENNKILDVDTKQDGNVSAGDSPPTKSTVYNDDDSKKARFLKREHLLKQRLYQKYYPKVPYLTIFVNSSSSSSSSAVDHHLIKEEVEKVLKKKK